MHPHKPHATSQPSGIVHSGRCADRMLTCHEFGQKDQNSVCRCDPGVAEAHNINANLIDIGNKLRCNLRLAEGEG